MDAPKQAYYPHVEGLRGLAALYVFLYHLSAGGMIKTSPLHGWRPYLAPLRYGHAAVAIFIVISGFCLAAPVVRAGLVFDRKKFARRRFMRLYPAYFAALVLSLPTFYYLAAVQGEHPIPAHVAIGVVTHVALIHNFDKRTLFFLNTPLWSIALEFQIYAIFALVLVPLWRRFGVGAQLVAALVIGLAPHFLLHGFLDLTAPWLVGLFAFGACAAVAVQRGTRANVPWRTLCALSVAIALILIVRSVFVDVPVAYLIADLATGLAVSLFLVASARPGRPWAPARVLAWPPIEKLGTFSYSLYLIHVIAIDTILAALLQLHAPAPLWAAGYVLAIPITVALAYAFSLGFERPFISPALRTALALSR